MFRAPRLFIRNFLQPAFPKGQFLVFQGPIPRLPRLPSLTTVNCSIPRSPGVSHDFFCSLSHEPSALKGIKARGESGIFFELL